MRTKHGQIVQYHTMVYVGYHTRVHVVSSLLMSICLFDFNINPPKHSNQFSLVNDGVNHNRLFQLVIQF